MDLLRETWRILKRRLGFCLGIAAWLGIAFAPMFIFIGLSVTNPILCIGSLLWIPLVIILGTCLLDAHDIVKER